MGFCHSVGSEKAGYIGSLVVRIGMATKNLFLCWAEGFQEFVFDVGRLDLTYCRECGTKTVDDGEENQALLNTIMAPLVRYKEVCCLTIGMTCYESSLLYVGFFFF